MHGMACVHIQTNSGAYSHTPYSFGTDEVFENDEYTTVRIYNGPCPWETAQFSREVAKPSTVATSDQIRDRGISVASEHHLLVEYCVRSSPLASILLRPKASRQVNYRRSTPLLGQARDVSPFLDANSDMLLVLMGKRVEIALLEGLVILASANEHPAVDVVG
jgi:hypothetical protein